jgi:hypothetical protein
VHRAGAAHPQLNGRRDGWLIVKDEKVVYGSFDTSDDGEVR